MQRPNVGDTIRIIETNDLPSKGLVGNYYLVTGLDTQDVKAFFIDTKGSTDPGWVTSNMDKWEIVTPPENKQNTSTTVQEFESNETSEILRTIDESIFYDGYVPAKSLAKANEIISTLVHVLVSKGVISLADVARIVKPVPAFTNVQSSKED